MSKIINQTPSLRAAAVGVILLGFFSSAHASAQSAFQGAVPNSSTATSEHIAPADPVSHLPWLAPVGHRQPRRAEAPQSEYSSASENEQARQDRTLNRKLIICRGC